MIFTPNRLEAEKILEISQIMNNDYTIIRLTPTMIEKNNLDANGIFRNLLLEAGIVDYNTLNHGGENGIIHTAKFIQLNKTEDIKLKFYRVKNNRGDCRFSFETIKRRMNDKELNEGDLLYISTYKDINQKSQIFIINLTNNTPTKYKIITEIGVDEITSIFEEIKPKIREILHGGFYDNSKGEGKVASKDVGDTLESLLEINTNNRTSADYKGKIEVKSKGKTRTLDTLFTLRPCFEGTLIANVEPKDKSRVSAFTRLYGYDSDKHPGYNSLYITIGSEDAPQNNQGFYLEVDDNKQKVSIMHIDKKNGKREETAYWTFSSLRKSLNDKHPSTLWFKAESRTIGDMTQFKYNEVEFSRSPQFITFISLIKKGIVTYDWRGYTTKSGKYKGKNHGNAWRLKPKYKRELFGEVEKIVF